jgi:hypothetical protein
MKTRWRRLPWPESRVPLGELIAVMAAVVVIVSFARVCLAGWRYVKKRYLVEIKDGEFSIIRKDDEPPSS